MKGLTKAVHGHSLVVASILALVFSVTYAVANDATQSSSTGTLYACVTKKYKTLNLTTKSKPCPKGQRKISWNAQGRDGAQGPAGVAGVQGPAGVAGLPGPAGVAGVQGTAGADGANGLNGATGATGMAGAPGPTGPTGPQGEQGPQGVVDVAAINGTVPTVSGGTFNWNPVGPTATVTTDGTQRLVASGAIGLGRTVGDTFPVYVSLCLRPSNSPSDLPFAFSGLTPVTVNPQVVAPLAGAIPPGPGTWLVNVCVSNPGPFDLDDNETVNGWVMVVN